MTARNALLGACLALPLATYGEAALAGPPSGLQTITVPPGAVVLILPGASGMTLPPGVTSGALPAGDPMLRLVAVQDALMRNMMAEMNAAFAQPMGPMPIDQMLRAAFGGLPTNAAGSGMEFTSMSDGPGVCSERVTYVYPANGAKPQVTMTRSGDGCGAFGVTGPRGVMQAMPIQPPEAPPSSVAPAGPSHEPHLWTVSDPPQEIVTRGTPPS
jgi:hypothetical protein